MNLIVAVVVTYNPVKSRLIEQKLSLENQVDIILYVDNGSDGNSQSEVTEILDSNNVLLAQVTNEGIAKAQNIGITCAKKLGATHILLMDQDSVPLENMVKELLNAFDHDTNVGAVGPYIVDAFEDNKECFGIQVEGFRIKRIPLKDNYTNVTYVIASGCLIPINVLDKVGGMLDSMFIDGVDFEWCLRARSKGYKICQAKNAKLIHELGNGNTDKILSHSPLREYYIMRNSLRMASLNYIPTGYRIRRICMSIMRFGNNIIKCKREYISNDWKAIVDFINKK